MSSIVTKTKGSRSALWVLLLVVPIIAIGIAQASFSTTNSGFTGEVVISKNCLCRIMKAEIWEIKDTDPWDIEFVEDVTYLVKYQDGYYKSFNKDYLLKVYFNKNLENGDIIRLYARFNTVPDIKNVTILDINFDTVGGGEVFAQWDYYDLTIDNVTSPQSVFYLSVDGSNPSSQNIRIDLVKCAFGEKPDWRDDEGDVVKDYMVEIYYEVTATGNIDTDNVYLEIKLEEEIVNTLTDDHIRTRLIENELIKVGSFGTAETFSSRILSVIDHASAGVDNITININVYVEVTGKIIGSDDWVAIEESFDSVRSIPLSWY